MKTETPKLELETTVLFLTTAPRFAEPIFYPAVFPVYCPALLKPRIFPEAYSFIGFARSPLISISLTMSSSAAGPGRGSLYRQLSRGSSGGSSSIENLPPRTLARVAREVRDLHKSPPEGVRLVVDSETGVPSNLGELVVSSWHGIC